MCFLSVCRCTATCIVSFASIAGTHGVNVFALINNSVTDQTLPRVDRMLQTINKFNDTIKSNYIKSNQTRKTRIRRQSHCARLQKQRAYAGDHRLW